MEDKVFVTVRDSQGAVMLRVSREIAERLTTGEQKREKSVILIPLYMWVAIIEMINLYVSDSRYAGDILEQIRATETNQGTFFLLCQS